MYPGLFLPVIYIIYTQKINKNFIFLFSLTVFISITNEMNILSLLYYIFGLFYLFQRIEISKKNAEILLNTLIYFFFITISLDFINPEILNFFSDYPRRVMIDDRFIYEIQRPAGFFREPSGLALVIGVIYIISLLNNLNVNFKILILSGLLTFSFSFILFYLFAFLIIRKSKTEYITISFILLFSLIFFESRISIIYNFIIDPNINLVELNLSFTKRYIQPLYAMFNFFLEDMKTIFFGFGPGNYKEYLINKYYYINGSDLSMGYLLNVFGNYMLSFGLPFSLILLYCLNLVHNEKKKFLLIIFILFQGIAVIHPAFILTSLKIKSN